MSNNDQQTDQCIHLLFWIRIYSTYSRARVSMPLCPLFHPTSFKLILSLIYPSQIAHLFFPLIHTIPFHFVLLTIVVVCGSPCKRASFQFTPSHESCFHILHRNSHLTTNDSKTKKQVTRWLPPNFSMVSPVIVQHQGKISFSISFDTCP